MARTRVEGINAVLKKLEESISIIEERVTAGLIRGAIIIRRSMEKESPLTPVDTGNLRHSFFVLSSSEGADLSKLVDGRSFKGPDAQRLASEHQNAVSQEESVLAGSDRPTVALGYSAYYAWFVHENLVATNWQRPGSGPKFLESAIKNNEDAVLSVIAKEVSKI